MKKLLTISLFSFLCTYAFGQNADMRRKIEVTGIAEQEVTPDIINVSISLREYMDGKKRVAIAQLEMQLENAVKEAGISKDDFTVADVMAWHRDDDEKKTTDFLASKQFAIRFHDLDKYNQIMSKLDPKGIQSTDVESYDYSKIIEVKRDLKVKALLAAKEKATYLLNSINEKLGRPITISEEDANNYQGIRQFGYTANTALYNKASAEPSDISFNKIKLSFQVQVVFEIEP